MDKLCPYPKEASLKKCNIMDKFHTGRNARFILAIAFFSLIISLSSCHSDEAPVPSREVPEAFSTGGGSGSGNTGDDDDPVIQGGTGGQQANPTDSTTAH